MTTTDVDNWPADADGVDGPDLMARFQRHAERFDTEIVFDHIQSVDLKARPFRLAGDNGSYTCDALIIATGASAPLSRPALRGSDDGKGVSACRDLRRLLLQRRGRRRRRRRQHGRRGSRSTCRTSQERHGRSFAATSSAPRRFLVDRLLAKTKDGGNMHVLWDTRSMKCSRFVGRDGVRLKHTKPARRR